jgi:hypothetical protein
VRGCSAGVCCTAVSANIMGMRTFIVAFQR